MLTPFFSTSKATCCCLQGPNPRPMNATEEKAFQEAVAKRSSVLTDLHRAPQGSILMTAVAPLADPDGRPIAVVLLRSDPGSLLYPLIQSWPTSSETAETLLVRKDGDEVLFLNELRHRPNSALSLRESLSRQELPAVQAVQGKQGIFQGKDYRGEEVLADLSPIPGSPWFMVAKVDAKEILAEARYRGAVIAVFAALFILLAGECDRLRLQIPSSPALPRPLPLGTAPTRGSGTVSDDPL